MDRDTNRYRIGPVCRFGPGGDFTSNWPANPKDYLQDNANPLGKLLNSIGKLISSAQNSKKYSVQLSTADNTPLQEIIENGQPKSNTSPAPATQGDNDICGQTLLFADDSGAVKRTAVKPKHRVRTHRRIAKKKPDLRIAGQGSLFEANAKSAQTA